ncbi:hypothetical protein BV20DRAFT_1057307 [Pilatotrama ljubarskyi]|nr:hypothetical protein BV20DRAFT_1057307 [Pilatotrama ljubarskyi]
MLRDDDPEREAIAWVRPYWDAWIIFPWIQDDFTGLREQSKYLRGHPTLVTKMATFMNAVAGKARSDDVGRIKKAILELAGLSHVPLLAQKTNRGFKHPTTGRLLCPVILLDKYDEDTEEYDLHILRVSINLLVVPALTDIGSRFCRGVCDLSEKRTHIEGENWPTFMYDMKKYDLNNVRSGLMRSRFVLDMFKLVYTGPNSVSEDGNKAKGKLPVSTVYSLKSVSIFSIIYVASLVRFALNSQSEWDDNDADFKGEEFFHSLMTAVVSDGDWEEDLCEWYTRRVYGNARCEDEPVEKQPTAYSLMLAQDAQRRKCEAQERRAQERAAQEQAAAQAQESGDDEGVLDDAAKQPRDGPAQSDAEDVRGDGTAAD